MLKRFNTINYKSKHYNLKKKEPHIKLNLPNNYMHFHILVTHDTQTPTIHSPKAPDNP